MSASSLFSRLARLVRRRPAPPPDLLHPYAAAVLPLADRAEALYHEWFEQTALVADSEKLANAAAIHRWEAATLARRLERIAVPSELERDHEHLIEAVHLTSRAAQLLSSGSRYHNANALCEGQTMLTEARTRRVRATASLRRFLAECPSLAETHHENASAGPEPAPDLAADPPAGSPERAPVPASAIADGSGDAEPAVARNDQTA